MVSTPAGWAGRAEGRQPCSPSGSRMTCSYRRATCWAQGAGQAPRRGLLPNLRQEVPGAAALLRCCSSVGAVSPRPKHREGRQASPPGGLSPPSGEGSQRRARPARRADRQPCRSWTLAPAARASWESTAQGSASPTCQCVLGSDCRQSPEFEGARGGLEEPRHPWQDHRGRWGPEGPPSGRRPPQSRGVR